MWEYARLQMELPPEQRAHIAECKACLALFNLCALADSREQIEWDSDEKERKRPAA
jgi:hypothetical protein